MVRRLAPAFTDRFIQRPVLALAVNILLLIAGLAAISAFPVRQYPAIESATISVETRYPGATAELMQGFVTTPLARAIATAEGVEWLNSSSVEGRSTINARLKLDTDSSRAMTEIMAKVNEVRYLLPPEATDPVITKSTGDSTAIMYLAFFSDQQSIPQITDYLDRVVVPRLASINGVGRLLTGGAQTLSMRIWLDPERMAALRIDASDVMTALRNNNVQAAPGTLKGDLVSTSLRADTDIDSVEAFRNMVVRAEGTRQLRLRDIATVEIGAKSYDQIALASGRQGVFIGINAAPTGNPLTIVEDVELLLEEMRPDFPPGLQFANQFDVARFVNASIEQVMTTLAEAVAIVVMVMFLFLGSVRSVLIPVVTIPLSLIGATVLMLMMGFSINLLTLLSMVLAIGLVVDDAIVVVENVYRHIERGETPMDAAIMGAREIIGPVIAMTITLVVVYAPIGFIGGFTGALFQEFAFTLASAVLVSGFVALTLSPMMASQMLPSHQQESRLMLWLEHQFSRLADAYVRALRRLLRARVVMLLLVVVMMAGLPFLYMGAQRELAPVEDEGTLYTAMKGPQHVNLDYSIHYANAMEQVLRTLPEYGNSFMLVGMDGYSDIFGGINLKPWGERQRSAEEVQQQLQYMSFDVDGVQVFVFPLRTLPGSGGGMPVQFVVTTPGPVQALYEAVEELKQQAWRSGLFMVVDSDLSMDKPLLSVKIDRAKANALGVPMQSIADTLGLFLNENYVNRFNLMGRSYEVIPQAAAPFREQRDNLGQYYVKARQGNMVPLSVMVTMEESVGPNQLPQFNQLNAATVRAIPLPGVSMGQAVQFFQQQSLPVGFSHDWQGESRQYVQEGDQLIFAFAFAMVVIYMVLAAQFNSLKDPIIILVTVPLSLWGALLSLYLGWSSLNIYTQIGLVTLIGLISKHGILMVEFANQMQLQGMDKMAAITEAAKVRLRPILMTTAAMVTGLIPLISSSGAGAASRFAIGIVIVTGMLIGTLFTLFVLPAVYSYLAGSHNLGLPAGGDSQEESLLPR